MKTGTKVILGVVGLFVLAMAIGDPKARSSQGKDQPAVVPPVPASETRYGPNLDDEDTSARFEAHVIVEQQLRDPNSAIFDKQNIALDTPSVLVRRIKGHPRYVCGWVNSKNGFGGYSGDVAYTADVVDRTAVVDASGDQIKAACAS